MAAEKLQMAASEGGHEIKVETQGSIGAENVLTAADIAAADAVIIAADKNVALSRKLVNAQFRSELSAAGPDRAYELLATVQ
jgi:PTS system fructose-specific IIC component